MHTYQGIWELIGFLLAASQRLSHLKWQVVKLYVIESNLLTQNNVWCIWNKLVQK